MSFPLWPKGGVKNNSIPLHNKLHLESTEIDLRESLKGILDGTDNTPQRGHWVILRRMNRNQRCECWNKVGTGDSIYDEDNRKYDEPLENCPLCDGSGYTYNDELHITRRRLVSPVIGMSNQERETPIGIMNVAYVVYYFKHNVSPHREDKIIEIENNAYGKPVLPPIHTEQYNISVVEPLRDQLGRIEYWRASVKAEVI